MIKKLIIIFICLGCILVTFLKMDKITDFFVPFIEQDTKVIATSANSYKKNTDYLFVQNTNNFGPLSRQDIKNVFYTIVNNGWKTFTYYCPKEYTDCLKEKSSNHY